MSRVNLGFHTELISFIKEHENEVNSCKELYDFYVASGGKERYTLFKEIRRKVSCIDYRHKTQEQINFLTKCVNSNMGFKEITSLYNKKFGKNEQYKTIGRYCNIILGIHTDYDGFRSLRTDERLKSCRNTAFKNQSPIGSIRTKNDGDLIKIRMIPYDKIGMNEKDECWIPLSRYVYEKEYGNIEDDDLIFHLDGNTHNNDISNLMAVKSGDLAFTVKEDMFSKNPDLQRLAFKVAKLYRLNKKIKGENNE